MSFPELLIRSLAPLYVALYVEMDLSEEVKFAMMAILLMETDVLLSVKFKKRGDVTLIRITHAAAYKTHRYNY